MKIFSSPVVLFLIAFGMMGCKGNYDEKSFNGDIVYIQNDVPEDKAIGVPVELKALYLGSAITVQDSILVCWTPKDPDVFFHVYNLKTGELCGKFCHKGRGPEETVATAPIFQIYKENGAMKALVNFHNERKIMHWNITESIRQQRSVFEGMTPRYDKSVKYKEIFWLNPGEVIGYVSSEPLTFVHDSATLPYWIKCAAKTGKPVVSYDLFAGTLEWERKREQSPLPDDYYYSMNCISPDRSKIAMGMAMLAQINVLDLDTGRQTGYRLKGMPGFEIFHKNLDDAKVYFTQVQADDSHIYALYSDKKYGSGWGAQDLLYIFNWNGELVRKVRLANGVKYISVGNPGILYALDDNEEYVYKYNLVPFI